MSLWGKQDRKTLTGTVTVASNSAAVTGAGTTFTTECEVGDIFLAGTDLDSANRISAIASNTSLTLTANFTGSDVGASKAAYIRETPRHLSPSESNAIFGVDNAEVTGGGNDVVEVSVTAGGTGYVNAADAAVTFGTGSAAATAVVTAGKVTSVTVTAGGNDNSAVPVVTINGPTASTFDGSNAGVVNVGANTIALTTAQVAALAIGDAVTYSNGGGGNIAGLTNGTKYYVESKPSSTTITLSATSDPLSALDITGLGTGTSHTLTGDTATGVATLGGSSGGQGITPGWVKRTVGTGGRAGRVTYETLVASGSVTTDAADDIQFPDA
tara:strand:+ start:29032 stop:30012 length:981 start_codon:yes stop_codon:yes gene_type:complete